MKEQNRQQNISRFGFSVLLLILIMICSLYTWIAQSIEPLYDLSGSEQIPVSINSNYSANYSPDDLDPVAEVKLSLLLDLIVENDSGLDPADRFATLEISMLTSIPTVTAPGITPGELPPTTATFGTPTGLPTFQATSTQAIPTTTSVHPTLEPTSKPTSPPVPTKDSPPTKKPNPTQKPRPTRNPNRSLPNENITTVKDETTTSQKTSRPFKGGVMLVFLSAGYLLVLPLRQPRF